MASNIIRKVQVTSPGTSCEHVHTVRFTAGDDPQVRVATREKVHNWINEGYAFATFNPATGASAPVAARTTSRGVRYIATVGNGRGSDNLLHLPRF